MHFTLKIRWSIFEEVADPLGRPGPTTSLAEEAVMFVPAALVTVRAWIPAYEQKPDVKPPTMESWQNDSYQNYLDVHRDEMNDGATRRLAGRLIEVIDDNNVYTWYLASFAWLLGPNGQTIERIAP